MSPRKKNPYVEGRPGLMGYRKEFRPLSELAGSEVIKLDFSAFSVVEEDGDEERNQEEWSSLGVAQRHKILLNTDRGDAVGEGDDRSCWLPPLADDAEDVEFFIKHNRDSKRLIKALVDIFVRRFEHGAPDWDYAYETASNSFQYWLRQHADDLIHHAESNGYEDEVAEIMRAYSEKGYSVDQIRNAIDVALRDEDFYDANEVDEDHQEFFVENVEGYIILDSDDVRRTLEMDGLSIAAYTEEEIEEALDQINRQTDSVFDNRRFTAENFFNESYGMEGESGQYTWVAFKPLWDRIANAVDDLLDAEAPEGADFVEVAVVETPIEQRIVHRFKDGSYVAELLPSEYLEEGAPYRCAEHGPFYPETGDLYGSRPHEKCPRCSALSPRNEGSLFHCIGSPEQPFVRKAKRGVGKGWSLRTQGGKRKIAVFADVNKDGTIRRIDQAKGYRNRLPGFEASVAGGRGRDGKFKPTEVLQTAEFVRTLGIDPFDVLDLQPGMRAAVDVGFGENNQEAKKVAVALRALSPSFNERADAFIADAEREARRGRPNPPRYWPNPPARRCRACGGDAGGFCGG